MVLVVYLQDLYSKNSEPKALLSDGAEDAEK